MNFAVGVAVGAAIAAAVAVAAPVVAGDLLAAWSVGSAHYGRSGALSNRRGVVAGINIGSSIYYGDYDSAAFGVGSVVGGLGFSVGAALESGWRPSSDHPLLYGPSRGSVPDWLATMPTDSGWLGVAGGIAIGFGTDLSPCP